MPLLFYIDELIKWAILAALGYYFVVNDNDNNNN